MDWINNLPAWVQTLLSLAGYFLIGILASFLIMTLSKWQLRRRNSALLKSVRTKLEHSVYWFFPLLAMILGYSGLNDLTDWGYYTLLTLFYIVSGWLSLGIFQFFADVIRHRFDITEKDNLDHRKVITQIDYLEDVARVIVIILFFALIMLQFESVRRFGTSILASAGIAGIIIGIAAQGTITNLLAGFQIAFTQPIRIDDVVIVEGEWGRIEDITLTYVVVRIWDQRRLITPIRHFIEKPFQNWTRTSSELLGTVFLYLDYQVPIEVIRNKLRELLEAHTLWDQRVSVVQVTDSRPNAMEVRLLMSARNSPDAFDLRCDVREQMIEFIRQKYPEALPKQRVWVEEADK